MNVPPTLQTPGVIPVDTPPKAVRQLNQESLTIRSWEVDYATLLSPFITTPRGAKRFANIYRLIKAPLPPEDLAAFEGTAASPGEFQAAMFLLAVVAGYPQLSAWLFKGFDNDQTATITAQNFFASVDKYLPEHALSAELQSCINRVGISNISQTRETFLSWIPRVARFSFYTAEVSEASA